MTRPPSFQPASPRDQVISLLVMLLVLGLCVGVTATLNELVEEDSSCAGHVIMGGKSYVCVERGEALHCYRKECEP